MTRAHAEWGGEAGHREGKAVRDLHSDPSPAIFS